MELKILTDILQSDCYYWIACDENNIMIISIPEEVKRIKNYDEIKIIDIDKLSNMFIQNLIILNNNFPPFQLGLKFGNLKYGFPIKTDKKIVWNDLLIELFKCKSDSFFEYENIFNEFIKNKE